MKYQRIMCAFGLCVAVSIADATPIKSNEPTIKIHHPILTLMHKDGKDARLLFEMVNQSQHPQTLIAAYSPLAKRTHLDQHAVGSHGFRLDSVTVAPKVRYEFEPKGTTILMRELTRPVHNGDMVPVTLIFADGSSFKLAARAEISNTKVG